MISTHSYTADFEIDLRWFSTCFEIEITYSYTPGEPERGPTYSSGGEPATAPEIEIISAMWREANTIDPYYSMPDAIQGFLNINPLSDALYDILVQRATEEQ